MNVFFKFALKGSKLFIIICLVVANVGFEDETFVLIAPVPGYCLPLNSNEPRCVKTGLRGFRPGPT